MKKALHYIALASALVLIAVTCLVAYRMYDFTRPIEFMPVKTQWAQAVDTDRPLDVYPRPQLRREQWKNLNGPWQYAVTDRSAPQPDAFSEVIIVPFAIESTLSGVGVALLPDQRLWYRRYFSAAPPPRGERLLLHFGAVDWEAEVWLNGTRLGIHQGGYTPFSFDVTDTLRQDGEQELVVAVWDPTNLGPGAYGKQHLVPHGIRYTPVSGIWQTVWTEYAPTSRVEHVLTVTDLAAKSLMLTVNTSSTAPGDEIELTVYDGSQEVARQAAIVEAGKARLSISPSPLRLWSPDDPFLYDVRVRLMRAGVVLDNVETYFGARDIRTASDSHGITRIFLNGRPLFHLGLLDQGWWPDGLYTAPTDEALAFDLKATRQMGFNTIRKHVKVEPARWYWHADRMGVLVWQDMPSGDGGADRYRQILRQARDILSAHTTGNAWHSLERPQVSAAMFEKELSQIMGALDFFPSIVAWVPFNEAWGQFDTDRILAEVEERDPSRLTDGPSGWFDTGVGDLLDLHVYGREADFVKRLPDGRALVYGEFGGLALPVADHLTVADGWGYASFEQDSDFEQAYREMMSTIQALIPSGLAGAIYTQTTDVESEINGLMTYDRRVFKISPDVLRDINQKVIATGSLEPSEGDRAYSN